VKYLRNNGIYYIGTGVSGGEDGARHGPSLMPGGSAEAWSVVAFSRVDFFFNVHQH
jgi:6-phosphogluconate dehydrogenase